MPVLSMFYGIIVRMQSEPNGKHHIAHIHATYGENEVVMSLKGEIIEGKFPKKQQKLLEAWVILHEEDLEANWEILLKGEEFFKIEPLQ